MSYAVTSGDPFHSLSGIVAGSNKKITNTSPAGLCRKKPSLKQRAKVSAGDLNRERKKRWTGIPVPEP
jgi:hypothetical protein